MKNKLKILFILFMILILISCEQKIETKGTCNAKYMIIYVNYFNKVMDKLIIDLQNDLKLNTDQTEILYLSKSEILAKIPEIRKIVFEFQLKLINLIEKDTIVEKDILDCYDQLNFYEKVLKDTLVKRLLELHSTLNIKQKEKLAKYIDLGIALYIPMPSLYSFEFIKFGIKLYKDLDLSVKQKRMFIMYYFKTEKMFNNRMKMIYKNFILQKNNMKKMILSDSIQMNQIDEFVYSNFTKFNDFKNVTTGKIIELHKSLSNDQKKVLVKFISEFNLL